MSGRILVVGSINADDAIRLERFPGPGETVSARTLTSALGGKGANQAVAAARAGAEVRMVGAIGAADGDSLRGALEADGIDTSGVVSRPGTPSGRAIVLIDDEAENSIVVVPGANADIPAEAVKTACATLGVGDVLLLQHEVPIETSRLAAALGREAGATVVWNAAPAPTDLGQLVDDIDLLLVNEHELAAIAALLRVDGTELDDLIAGVAAASTTDVICTLGAAGAAYRVAGESGVVAARRVNAVDTTAAGDTFAGYLAALHPLPLADRLRRALDAASLAVTRNGATPSIPHRTEVEQLASAPIRTGAS